MLTEFKYYKEVRARELDGHGLYVVDTYIHKNRSNYI